MYLSAMCPVDWAKMAGHWMGKACLCTVLLSQTPFAWQPLVEWFGGSESQPSMLINPHAWGFVF
jgi:hypothetical protein